MPSLFLPYISDGMPSPSAQQTPGNLSIPVQLFMAADQKRHPCILLFQDAVLRSGATSHSGWWITQPDAAPPVAVACCAHGVERATCAPAGCALACAHAGCCASRVPTPPTPETVWPLQGEL